MYVRTAPWIGNSGTATHHGRTAEYTREPEPDNRHGLILSRNIVTIMYAHLSLQITIAVRTNRNNKTRSNRRHWSDRSREKYTPYKKKQYP